MFQGGYAGRLVPRSPYSPLKPSYFPRGLRGACPRSSGIYPRKPLGPTGFPSGFWVESMLVPRILPLQNPLGYALFPPGALSGRGALPSYLGLFFFKCRGLCPQTPVPNKLGSDHQIALQYLHHLQLMPCLAIYGCCYAGHLDLSDNKIETTKSIWLAWRC